MSRFNPILMEKVEAEQAEEERQQKLMEQAGIIPKEDIVVKEKGPADYAKGALKAALYLVFVGLVFCGIVTLINPESQRILFGLIGLV